MVMHVARHDVVHGRQSGRVMTDYWQARPLPQHGEWESPQWWQARRDELSARDCARNTLHGTARTYMHVSALGKALGYHCPLCGWDEPMLVQDGPAAPCAPVREITLNRHQLAALGKTKVAQRKGARVRAENVAKFGVKRRKWWEDDDDVV